MQTHYQESECWSLSIVEPSLSSDRPRDETLLSLLYNQTMRGVRRYDVVLIGGGVIGSSVAMALGERGLKTAVVDIDLSGRLRSSEKNAGGVRACARTLRARRAG